MTDSTTVFNDLDPDCGLLEESVSVRAETECEPDWFDTSKELVEKHQTQTLQFEIGDWLNQGKALADKHQTHTLQWEFGDWFNRCPIPRDISQAPNPYDVAEKLTGISRRTLYDWASTAQRVPISVRTEKLTFTHQRAIANGLPKADEATQQHWIEVAINEGLSVKQLEERLRYVREPECGPEMKSFQVKLPLDLYTMLRHIARGRESKVQLIAAEFLTEYLAGDEMAKMAEFERQRAEERTYERRKAAGTRTARAYDPLGLQR